MNINHAICSAFKRFAGAGFSSQNRLFEKQHGLIKISADFREIAAFKAMKHEMSN